MTDKKKSILKAIGIFLLIFFIIAVPVCVVIGVLYSNNKFYLNKFIVWIKEPGNLNTFFVGIGMYFPVICGIWKCILLSIESKNIFKNRKLFNSKKFKKIYDDDKNTYIYHSKKENILTISIKSPINGSEDELLELLINESKARIAQYQKNKSIKKPDQHKND